MAWGNSFCITFIVLSSQFFIYFVSQYRILLIRIICLVFLFKMIFCPSMASAQGGSFFPALTEFRILCQLQCGVAIDQLSNHEYICFSIVCYFNLFIYWEISYSSLRTYFSFLILGSLCMPEITSTILRKVF